MDMHDAKGDTFRSEFVGDAKRSFEPWPLKPPQPHYTYIAQAPDDKPDRDFEKEGLFASCMICIVMPLLGIGAVIVHFKYGFPF